MKPLRNSLLQDLVAAVTENDEARVLLLLKQGVSPDEFDLASNGSALHAAVSHHPDLVRVLLPHSKHPDLARVCGQTALLHAVHEIGECSDPVRRAGLMDAIGVLLDRGAAPQAGGNFQNALYLSRRLQLPEVEAMLMQRISSSVPAASSPSIPESGTGFLRDPSGPTRQIGIGRNRAMPLLLGLASSGLIVASLLLELAGQSIATLGAAVAVVVSAGLSSLGCLLLAIHRFRKLPVDRFRLSVFLNCTSFLVSWALVLLLALVLHYALQIDWQGFGDQIGK